MDWSLMQRQAPRPFLRPDLGYEKIWVYPVSFRSNKKVYYFAMIMDPIMRSSWLFYVMFPGQRQLNATTALVIAIGEVFRRFMWNFFRLENEHMTNVKFFIASRDVPLPFFLEERPERKVALEVQSSMMDYTRNDEERSMNAQDEAAYDC
jgi:xenotropic and polytropic retrovirus receptor 1